jgi:hypothetical protein
MCGPRLLVARSYGILGLLLRLMAVERSKGRPKNLASNMRKLGPLCRFLLGCWLRLIRWWQRRCAIGATRRHQWDSAQAVWALSSGGRRLRFLWLIVCHQRIHRAHDKEVYDERNYQEGDNRINESPNIYCSFGIVRNSPFQV